MTLTRTLRVDGTQLIIEGVSPQIFSSQEEAMDALQSECRADNIDPQKRVELVHEENGVLVQVYS